MLYKSVEYLAFKGLIIVQNTRVQKNHLDITYKQTYLWVLMHQLVLLVFKLTNCAMDVTL